MIVHAIINENMITNVGVMIFYWNIVLMFS